MYCAGAGSPRRCGGQGDVLAGLTVVRALNLLLALLRFTSFHIFVVCVCRRFEPGLNPLPTTQSMRPHLL